MGGSLAKALRQKYPSSRILAVTRNAQALRYARAQKIIHQGSSDLAALVPLADFIIICTPVQTVPSLVKKIDRYAKSGVLVTDVGSTKQWIQTAVKQSALKKVVFIGSHPMAGSHLSGVYNARESLYQGSIVFMTPERRHSQKKVSTLKSFWRFLGARVIFLSPKVHDQMVSRISHVPHALAVALMDMISPKMFPYASTGFYDTTRIAQGDPNIWVPIFLSNRKNLVHDLKKLSGILRKMMLELSRQDEQKLMKRVRLAAIKRRRL